MKKNHLIFLAAALISSHSMAAAPTVDNYRQVVRGILSKFDRDYSSLNGKGEPDPGALATVEIFLKVFNDVGIKGPGQYDLWMDNTTQSNCNVPGPNCSHTKVEVKPSIHQGDSTLFGVAQAFDLDIAVWTDSGLGFSKFLEGSYSPVDGTAGRGNLTLISCGGCSTVGHSQVEWDGTGAQYHLRSKMYDTRMDIINDKYAGVIVDAVYNPLSGEMKLAIAGNQVCDSRDIGDSFCAVHTPSDQGGGYSAILHANTKSGNVYVSGIEAGNISGVKASGIDAMCIKADKSEDLTGADCVADGINNFVGINAFAPIDAPIAFIASGSPWPHAEINDTPTF